MGRVQKVKPREVTPEEKQRYEQQRAMREKRKQSFESMFGKFDTYQITRLIDECKNNRLSDEPLIDGEFENSYTMFSRYVQIIKNCYRDYIDKGYFPKHMSTKEYLRKYYGFVTKITPQLLEYSKTYQNGSCYETMQKLCRMLPIYHKMTDFFLKNVEEK